MWFHYRLITHVPPVQSGRESPIAVEFEDEKTATLLELLNQISEELKTSRPATMQQKLQLEDARKKFLLPNARPPLPKEIKPIVKEYGVNSPASVNQSKTLTTRTQTLPEIQTTKKALTKSQETPLSAGNLMRSNMGKKTAPMVPPIPKPPQNSHTPFAVELGKAGRKPGYAKYPQQRSNEQIPQNYDLNVVDLEDDNEMMDDISQFSSDAFNSPTKQDPKMKK